MTRRDIPDASADFKILFFDIETAPNVGYTWGKYEQNVIAFTKEWYMLSFSAKWAHETTPQTFALPDFPAYDRSKTDDRALTSKLWSFIDEADLVIAHNGDKFDIRKANARFLFHGLRPPAPYKTIDTLKLARKHFSMNSNSLNDLARYLGIGAKVSTGGFELWLKCMAGDSRSWARMKKYNAHDVVLLEQVYERLRPWHVTHPNIAIKGDGLACPACGGTRLQSRGFTFLTAYKTKRYQCRSCGKWSKGKSERLVGEHLR